MQAPIELAEVSAQQGILDKVNKVINKTMGPEIAEVATNLITSYKQQFKANGGKPLSVEQVLDIVQDDLDPIVDTVVDTASKAVVTASPLPSQPVVRKTLDKLHPQIAKVAEKVIVTAIQTALKKRAAAKGKLAEISDSLDDQYSIGWNDGYVEGWNDSVSFEDENTTDDQE